VRDSAMEIDLSNGARCIAAWLTNRAVAREFMCVATEHTSLQLEEGVARCDSDS